MSDYLRAAAVLPQLLKPIHRDARYVLHAAGRGHAESLLAQSRVETQAHKRCRSHGGHRRAGIQRQANRALAFRADETSHHDDQTARCFKRNAHKTTAVLSGIAPV